MQVVDQMVMEIMDMDMEGLEETKLVLIARQVLVILVIQII